MQRDDLIDVTKPDAAELRAFLVEQNISLKANELAKMRSLLERDPSLVELHIFNVMWSEHCSYKSSKALLKTLPTRAPHVVLGPGEDAGIIRFFEKDGRSHCLVVAHESHNHPSQVLPVEGAATGIGGIVRDVYCMGADVIGVMDPLRFGDPDGQSSKRVRDIVRGVVDGIAQYGNALGVPNLGGDTYFDSRFDDNCLVNVVAIGAVDEQDIVRSRAPKAARKEPHDIVLIGKPTDASGFGGAAFASGRLSGDQEREQQEAVQIPDPFLKRVLVEATKVALSEAKAAGVGLGFKDLGAGGISCAVSEMAQAGGVGAVLDLDKVNTATLEFPPQVIACSETQERYAMIVPKHFTKRVCAIYNDDFEMPHLYPGAGAYVIGATTLDDRFCLMSGGRVVCDAGVDVITTGIEYDRLSREPGRTAKGAAEPPATDLPVKDVLLELLATYNIGDKSILFQHYDSEVQGRAVLRPGESDAAVAIVVPGEPVAVATGIGGNPAVGEVDPYLGGAWAVVEAVRNVACVGATALAVTDCLNYGDPEDPEVFWEFAEGVRGIGDACRGLMVAEDASGIPVVSGNVSFYNQSGNGRPIAPSPVVACVGRLDEASVAQSMGFKRPGSSVVLLGALHGEVGGSAFAKRYIRTAGLAAPRPDFEKETVALRALTGAFRDGTILAAHDIAHGGLLVTLAEMVIASTPRNVGCVVNLRDALPSGAPEMHYLFSELGGVVVEVAADAWVGLRSRLDGEGVEWLELGTTGEHPALAIELPGESVRIDMDELVTAHRTDNQVNALFA